jgi:hypothetical protein
LSEIAPDSCDAISVFRYGEVGEILLAHDGPTWDSEILRKELQATFQARVPDFVLPVDRIDPFRSHASCTEVKNDQRSHMISAPKSI